jgi:hypothetical protein
LLLARKEPRETSDALQLRGSLRWERMHVMVIWSLSTIARVEGLFEVFKHSCPRLLDESELISSTEQSVLLTLIQLLIALPALQLEEVVAMARSQQSSHCKPSVETAGGDSDEMKVSKEVLFERLPVVFMAIACFSYIRAPLRRRRTG